MRVADELLVPAPGEFSLESLVDGSQRVPSYNHRANGIVLASCRSEENDLRRSPFLDVHALDLDVRYSVLIGLSRGYLVQLGLSRGYLAFGASCPPAEAGTKCAVSILVFIVFFPHGQPWTGSE